MADAGHLVICGKGGGGWLDGTELTWMDYNGSNVDSCRTVTSLFIGKISIELLFYLNIS